MFSNNQNEIMQISLKKFDPFFPFSGFRKTLKTYEHQEVDMTRQTIPFYYQPTITR